MTPANPDALADALNREPVELADDITPQEVMRLALDGIDLAYRAHGNNARVSMLAVQADWIMQHLARTEMWAKDEQAKRHAAEDRLVEVRSRAATAEASAAQLQAEVEALKGALKPFAEAAEAYGHSHDESQINERPAWAGKDYVEARLLAKHLRAARAATAREGQTHTPASGALKIEEADRDA